MFETVVGLFSKHSQAEDAARKLQTLGYFPTTISVITRERLEKEPRSEVEPDTLAWDDEDPIGLGRGAAVGGAIGLLIGLGGMLIPVVGTGLLGAVAGTGVGAVSGAVVAPLLDMFMGAGSDDLDVEGQTHGEVLLSVEVEHDDLLPVRDVMLHTGAASVEEVRFGDEPEKAVDVFKEETSMYGYSMDTSEYDPASTDRGPDASYIKSESRER